MAYIEHASKDSSVKPNTGADQAVKRIGFAQSPPEPTCSKHRDDQCSATRADDSFDLN
jgi:hypothetical protein